MSDEFRGFKSNIALSDITKLQTPADHKKWSKGIKHWKVENNCDLPQPTNPGNGPALNAAQALKDAHNVRLEKYNADLTTWRRRQLKGVNCISMTCGQRGQDLIEDCTEVDDAIAKLDAEYKPKGDATYAEVNSRWTALCLAACENVDSYVNKFDEIYSELKPHNELSRLNLIQKFIDGLGPAFDSWQESFSLVYNLTDESVTLGTVQARVRTQEQLMLKNRPTAFHAYGRSIQRPTLRRPGRPWCERCKISGHWEVKCWALHPELEVKWRKEFPGKAALMDARNSRQPDSHRRDFRRQTRQQNSQINRASSAPPPVLGEREQPPASARQEYAGVAIKSTTL
jgi:hypothetical protein